MFFFPLFLAFSKKLFQETHVVCEESSSKRKWVSPNWKLSIKMENMIRCAFESGTIETRQIESVSVCGCDCDCVHKPHKAFEGNIISIWTQIK